ETAVVAGNPPPKIRERPRFSINRRYISANGGGCGKSAATFPRTTVKSGKRRRFWRNAARSRKFRARSQNFACVPAYPRVFREIRAASASHPPEASLRDVSAGARQVRTGMPDEGSPACLEVLFSIRAGWGGSLCFGE